MLHYLDRFEFIHAHESKQKLTYIKACVYRMADMHFFPNLYASEMESIDCRVLP